MQKNKLAIVIALALVLSPVLNLQAEEGSSGASVDIKTNSDIRPLPPIKDPNFEFEGDRPRLPPPMPLNKERSGEKGDVGSIRAGLKGKMMSDDDDSDEDINDDKGGLRMKKGDRPQLSEEEKIAMKAKFDARKAELKAKIEARKDERKIKLEDKAKERVKNILANMFKMLNNQLERLTKADARIGEKLASLKDKGLDVSAASAQYIVAQTALAKAKVDVEATSSLSTEQTDTETSKETLRALVKTATDSIKAAGAEYRKIFPILPKDVLKAEVETSTSTSTSVTQ